MEEPKIVLDDKDSTIINGDWLEASKLLPNDSVDLIVTDPPYAMISGEYGKDSAKGGFMGKTWDAELPSVNMWKECLRVLKPGAFLFCMSAPRADLLANMILRIQTAGFSVRFSPVYHTFASGFPKALNISKAVDKCLGYEREITGKDRKFGRADSGIYQFNDGSKPNKYEFDRRDEPVSEEAKELVGSYGGMQLKPAIEVVIVAMKPLSVKTYVGQALKNKKGITWLDDGRIPYEISENVYEQGVKRAQSPRTNIKGGKFNAPKDLQNESQIVPSSMMPKGRFPADLLVEDDILNDGSVTRGQTANRKMHYDAHQKVNIGGGEINTNYGDFGSFSRYFDLDAWWVERIKQLPESAQRTFPFFIVPKASKREKDRGLDDLPLSLASRESAALTGAEGRLPHQRNPHPTIKPLKLMSWLIIIGSRENDVILDPFLGSGTTLLAAKLLKRLGVGVELNADYCDVAIKRLKVL